MSTQQKRQSRRLITAVSLMLALFLTACSGGGKPADGAPSGGSGSSQPAEQKLIIATQADAVTLDPPSQADIPSQMVTLHVFDTLVTRDAQGDIVGSLAEKWTWSDDGLTLTFNLKSGVKFHDDSDFNAEVVKANFERILDPDNALPYRSGFTSIQQIDVVDTGTIKFVMSEPNGAILARLASPTSGIISGKALAEMSKDDLARNPVGTGPFIFVDWKQKERIELKANPNFWGGKPKLDTLVFQPVPEDSTRVNMLESGQVHAAVPVGVQHLERLQSKPGLKAASVAGMDNLHMPMNLKKEALKDPRVRQAINYAIDREAIVKTLYRGYAEPLDDSPLAPAMWGYADVGDFYQYNPEKAKELLAEAGYANGFSMNLWVPDGRYLQDTAVAEALSGYLAEVGIQTNISKHEWGTYVGKIVSVQNTADEEWDALMISYAIGSQDADEGLSPLAQCGETLSQGGFNFSDYCDAGVDKALMDGRRLTDPADRLAAYAIAQKQIMEDAPWIFLVAYEYTGAHQDSVQGLELLPLGAASARNAYIGK